MLTNETNNSLFLQKSSNVCFNSVRDFKNYSNSTKTIGVSNLYRLWLGTAFFLALCWCVNSIILMKIPTLLTFCDNCSVPSLAYRKLKYRLKFPWVFHMCETWCILTALSHSFKATFLSISPLPKKVFILEDNKKTYISFHFLFKCTKTFTELSWQCNLDFTGCLYVNHITKTSVHSSYEASNPLTLELLTKVNNFPASWDSYLIWYMLADLYWFSVGTSGLGLIYFLPLLFPAGSHTFYNFLSISKVCFLVSYFEWLFWVCSSKIFGLFYLSRRKYGKSWLRLMNLNKSTDFWGCSSLNTVPCLANISVCSTVLK